MSRHNGRILAFQALYSWDVSKASVEDLLTFDWIQKDMDLSESDTEAVEEDSAEAKVSEVESGETNEALLEEKTFAGLIITGTIDHISEIDELIKNHLSAKWSLERLNKVSLAILRTGIYEMVFIKGAEKSIVIDEAVTIAKKFGADDSYKFINAVLDKISKENTEK